MSHRTTPPKFRRHLIAVAASAALNPAWAITLATSPPGTAQPYVAPNVILSLDDSTSMNTGMDDSNGNYLGTRREVLMKAVKETFNDTNLLPDRKIRLAWQSMNECTQLDGTGAGNLLEASDATATTSTKMNLMRLYEGTHRSNFIRYIDAYRTRSQKGWYCESGTFTHSLVKAADAYMRAPTHKNGPWSSNPGGSDTASTEYLGCRRNYHIVLTDGEWNSGQTNVPGSQKNYDGDRSYWPSHIPTATDAQTQLYRDRPETYSSIADWAFYSWANPLKTASELTGSLEALPEYRKAPATETFENRVTKTKATLDRYWNPRYNPATWPHLVTFTIGFSTDALPENNYKLNGTKHEYVEKITKPTSLVPYGYDGNFADYANGTYRWRASSDKGHDMWHAAINGRGQFYAVEKGEDLKEAFRQIVRTINSEVDPSITSTALSGSNLARSDVGKFTGHYEPQNAWKGFVKAETVGTDGSVKPDTGWEGKNTADRLDDLASLSSRVILSWNDASQGGVPFLWDNLSAAQKLALQKATDGTDQGATAGQDRLNYIRGDRSKEGTEPNNYTTSKPYRQRQSRQGDIVNSEVWYTGIPASNYAFKGYSKFTSDYKERAPMIYVGGNDGMLHGFSATDGSEKIAYVPQGVIPHLNRLTAPAYNQQHRYFVDGSPMTGDIDISTDPANPQWRTMLVGTLGAGGKGYFVLDVTNPTGFAADTTKAASLAVLDRTRSTDGSAPDCTLSSLSDAQKTACVTLVTEDRDIGHITAAPVRHSANILRATQITLLNNNRWAVVLGNGYNSTNQRPVLLVQYLDGSKELLRIPATTETAGTGKANDNGLSAPRLVDLNGDERPDIAYAGDNQGNLWKFDLTSYDTNDWGVAFNGAPLFTAQRPAVYGSSGTELPQPITVAPTVRANDRKKCEVDTATNECKANTTTAVGGMMVAFGTGRNVARNDPESTNMHTLYSVLDNTRYRYRAETNDVPKRLEIHPGKECTSAEVEARTCVPVPAPAALGAGVSNAKLLKQATSTVSGDTQATLDNSPLDTTKWSSYNGWYLDLPSIGERLLKPLEFYDGTNILTVWSQVPAKGSNVNTTIESCESGSVDDERQYRTFINIMDGAPPSVQLMAVPDDTTDIMVRRQVHKGAHAMITTKDKNKDIDTRGEAETLNRMPETTSRPSWRQMQ